MKSPHSDSVLTRPVSVRPSVVMGVIMNVLVPYMLNTNEWNWGLKTAFFYLGVGAPFAVGSWFIIPETKG